MGDEVIHTTLTHVDSSARICEPGGSDHGLILPIGGDAEAEWPRGAKIVVYGLALAYCFLGVSIVSEAFMTSIETITSKKKRIFDWKKQRHRTVKIWNETIANLTLMALGSSAPEILLNIVEVGKNRFFFGELGPGTIVGSAAFNLLVISAVCVMAIPRGESRLIKDTTVYFVTAVFSVFAYIWLIIILLCVTKDVVLLWEALVTLGFFPVLVITAFCADKGWINGSPATAQRQSILAAEMTRDELAELVRCIKAEFGDIDDETVEVLVERRIEGRPSMAAYRGDKIGRKKKRQKKQKMLQIPCIKLESESLSEDTLCSPRKAGNTSSGNVTPGATIEWAVSSYAVREGDQKVSLEVRRYGDRTNVVSCQYATRNGSAKAGDDFLHVRGTVKFDVNETKKKIAVTILDDDQWEQAEDFYVELFDAKCDIGTVSLGSQQWTTVTIIDDDDPGCLAFEKEFIEHDVDASPVVCVRVLRKHGSKGEIRCKYKTEDCTALAPLDYEALQSTLVMQPGEVVHDISVCVNSRGRYETKDNFRLILYEPEVCRFDAKTDGDELQNICTIELRASERSKAAVDRLANQLAMNWRRARIGRSNWKVQFISALLVGGSCEDQREARFFDWCCHLVALPWKLFFATVPPPDFGGGWWCFCIALLYIGLVTAVIGDLASLFGCALDLPDEVTAITFVALGTSLPDTFASATAAVQDPYADASITNITGSNSVNVFLGLGLPWTAAAFYWLINGQTEEWSRKAPEQVKKEHSIGVYVIKADSLAFSVAIFSLTALCAMAALWFQRKLFGGELGGPLIPKIAVSCYLVILWLAYIIASWIYIAL